MMSDKQKLSKIASLCIMHVGDKASLCKEIRNIIHEPREHKYCEHCKVTKLTTSTTSINSLARGICQKCEHEEAY